MASEREKEKIMEKLLGRGLRAREASSADAAAGQPCPEPALLAAYYDRALSAAENTGWEAHFSNCPRCQEQLAALARSDLAGQRPSQERAFGRNWVWNWRWLAPVGAAAAAVALWVTLRPPGPRIVVQPKPESETAIAPAAPPAAQPSNGAIAPNPPPAAASGKIHVAKSAAETTRKDETQKVVGKIARDTGLEASGALSTQKSAAPLKEKTNEEQRFAAGTLRAKAEEKSAGPGDARKPVSQIVQTETAQQDRSRAAPSAVPVQGRQVIVQPAQEPQRAEDKAEQDALGKLALRARTPAKAPATPAREEKTIDTNALAQREAPPQEQLRVEPQPYAALVAAAAGTFQIAPPSGKVLWRAGTGGKIERSRDAGKTWRAQASGVHADLLAGAAPSEVLCWIVGRAGTVLRTTDGKKWEKTSFPTQADLVRVDARDAQHASVTTAGGQSYVTDNGGRSWRAK